MDDIPTSILADSRIRRYDIYDPYGLNTILSRFSKRNALYDTYKKRTIPLVREDLYAII